MPRIEGRGIRKPRVAEVYMGEELVLRFDDATNPVFWFTVAFTPAEFGAVLTRYSRWLESCKASDALDALWLEPK